MSQKRLLFRLGFFYLSLIGFFGHLLPRPLMLRMAVLIGTVYWAIMKRDRERVRRNLNQIFADPRKVARLTRRTFINYAKYLVDYTRMDLLRDGSVSKMVRTFTGGEHIERAFSRGQGGLILTGHLGNWEMGGVFLSLLGYTLNVITALDVEARLHAYRIGLRHAQNIKVITLNGSQFSSLSILKALRANEFVALLADRELFGKGIPVTFFGKSVYFPVGPALLSALSGADLIPTFVLLDETNRYICLAEPPIPLQRTGDRDRDAAVNAQRIAEVMEKFIRLYPDQWFTFYDYFDRHRTD